MKKSLQEIAKNAGKDEFEPCKRLLGNDKKVSDLGRHFIKNWQSMSMIKWNATVDYCTEGKSAEENRAFIEGLDTFVRFYKECAEVNERQNTSVDENIQL